MSDTDTEAGALARLQDDPTSRKRFLRMVGGAGATGALGSSSPRAAATTRERPRRPRPPPTRRPRARGPEERSGDRQLRADARVPRGRLLQAGRRRRRDQGAGRSRLAKRIGETEQAHVEALTATVKKLGGTPAAKPQTKFDAVIDGGPKKILETAAAVENLGAAAYLGQAGRIKSKEILAAALRSTGRGAPRRRAQQARRRGFKGSARSSPTARSPSR